VLSLPRSLVQTDFDPAFKAFMTANSINHCVINMDGTKKVAIPEATMYVYLRSLSSLDGPTWVDDCYILSSYDVFGGAMLMDISGNPSWK